MKWQFPNPISSRTSPLITCDVISDCVEVVEWDKDGYLSLLFCESPVSAKEIA